MNNIKEMIEQYCPDGVPYVKLGSLMTRIRERAKEDSQISQVLVVSNTQGMVKAEEFRENTIHSADTSNYIIVRPGMLAYNPSRLNIGSIAMNKYDEPGLVSPMYVVFSIDETRVQKEYFEFIIKSAFVLNKIDSLKEEGARFRFDYSRWNWISVPLPPMEIQKEITTRLQQFQDLISSLSEEMEMRSIQYEYYRDKLLDLRYIKHDKEMTVGELFEIKNGLNKEKEAFGQGTPIINFTDVFRKRVLTEKDIKGRVTLTEEEIERYKARKGDVFFTRTSETKEEVGMASTVIEDIEDCVFSGFVLRARPKTDLLLPKFCSYYFSTKSVRDNIIKYASITTRATTTGPKLSKIIVPIISKEEQESIISKLEQFDVLCYDSEKGLPAEISIRKQQFEYYREKLLYDFEILQ